MRGWACGAAAVLATSLGACVSTEVSFTGEDECSEAEEASMVCEANTGPSGYSCLGAFSGTCKGDAPARWSAAWKCIRERCAMGIDQEEAERMCQAEGKVIPEECGDGVLNAVSFPDGGQATGP